MAFKKNLKKFTGLVSWARVYEPDEFMGKTTWKINFYTTKETKKAIKDAGIQSHIKYDDGETSGVSGEFCKFSRPVSAVWAGKDKFFAPPEIRNIDGSRLVWYTGAWNQPGFEVHGEPVLIGNGSTCEIEVEVYPTKMFGNGTRLESIRIIDLIEYVRPEEPDDEPEPEPEPEVKTVKVEQKAQTGSQTGTKKRW